MIDDFVSEDGLTIDWYKLLNSQEFQNRISGMEKYINDFEQKSKDKWKSLASYMNAWVQTDDIYNTLDDQMQKVVSQMVSNLEYGTDELVRLNKTHLNNEDTRKKCLIIINKMSVNI